ncbi:Altered inheritance of mitochondria protein 6 [Grifola frondosa]|uniref:Altered inheritance of mitochondria protein 6 n=1 Tax=Grifola frondosa TaxID=5627 RepID=A0A1C7MQZ0_GRIFR|nr:Altered inheritance of mitochondria protein 6 [Grifola frondosa]
MKASLASVSTLFLLAAGKPTVDQQIAFLESSNSSLLRYPTQFTQNIMPKAIHSHNDYWRDVPLLTALSFGVASVEADVWLINKTLFVGHESAALTPDRTLDSLYIQPLLEILGKQNPKDKFTTGSTQANGVFDTAGDQTLQLLVDIKTDGVEALPFILAAFQPLREAGYLTTFSNGTLTQISKALSPRDYFFDAPLMQLTDPSLNTTWDPTLSPLASTDYAEAVGWSGIGNISDAQRANITKFWDTPAWPIHARTNVWRELLNGGADWLNADDLKAASEF